MDIEQDADSDRKQVPQTDAMIGIDRAVLPAAPPPSPVDLSVQMRLSTTGEASSKAVSSANAQSGATDAIRPASADAVEATSAPAVVAAAAASSNSAAPAPAAQAALVAPSAPAASSAAVFETEAHYAAMAPAHVGAGPAPVLIAGLAQKEAALPAEAPSEAHAVLSPEPAPLSPALQAPTPTFQVVQPAPAPAPAPTPAPQPAPEPAPSVLPLVQSGIPTLGVFSHAAGVQVFSAASVLSGTTDPNGGYALSLTSVSADHGAATLLQDGSVRFVPNAGYDGPVVLTFGASDGHGATATIEAALVQTNAAPTASSASVSVVEGHAASGAVVGADTDGDTLSYALVQGHGPAHGSVSLSADGTFTYTAASGHVGADSFQVQVSDAHGGAVVQTVSVQAGADVVSAGVSGGSGHGVLTGSVAGSNASGDVMGYSLVGAQGGAANGAVFLDAITGGYTYTPTGAWHDGTSDSFTVAVSDGHGGVLDTVVTVVEHDVAPTLSASSGSTVRGGSVSASFTAADADGDAVTTTATADHGSVVVHGDGTYTYTETDLSFTGTDTLSFSSNDGHGGARTSQAVISVGDGSTIITSTSGGTGHGAITGSAVASDGFGDTMTYAVLSGPASGSVALDAATGAYTYTPDASWVGGPLGSFTVRATDGHGGSSDIVVSLAETNAAPTAALTGGTGFEGHSIAGAVVGADTDGDALTYSLVAGHGPSHGAVILAADGTYAFTPAGGFFGTDSFQVSVSDGHGGGVVKTISCVVADDSLTTGTTGGSGATGTAITGSVSASHASSDALAWTLSAAHTTSNGVETASTAHGSVSLDEATGAYTFTPAGGFVGTDGFTVQVADAFGNAASQSVSVSVTAHAPTVSGSVDLGSFSHGAPMSFTAAQLLGNASDVDGFSLALNGTPTANHGVVVDLGGGNFSLDPQGHVGSISLSYSISDGHGGLVSDTATAGSTNAAPTASTTGGTGYEGHVLTGAVVGADADGDGLTYSAVSGHGPSHGVLTLNADGTYSVAVTHGYSGSDSFEVQVSDGNGGSVVETVALTETAVAISTSAAGGSGQAEGSITGTVSASANSGDALSWSLSAAHTTSNGVETATTAHGSVSLNEATGAYTFTPAAGFVGTDSFAAVASDAFGNSASETVSAVALDNAPTVSGPVALGSGSHGTPFTVSAASLLANASDLDGQTLSLATAPTADHGATVVDHGNGTYGIDSNGYDGTIHLSYTVQDGAGGSASETASFLSTNAAPVAVDPGSVSVSEGSSVVLHASHLLQGATDADGDSLSITGMSASAGTLTDNGDGTWTLTAPSPTFVGSLTVSYSVSDGHGGSESMSSTIDYAQVWHGATVSGPVNLGTEPHNGTLVVSAATLLANASDADGATLSLSGTPTVNHGALTDNGDGTFSIDPQGYGGTVTVSYGVSDGHGNTTATSAHFDAIDRIPVVTGTIDLGTTSHSHPITISAAALLANVTDADSDTLAVAVPSVNHGSLVDNGDGTFTLDPQGYVGTITLSYSASDGYSSGQAADTATLTTTNAAPTISATGASTVRGGAVSSGTFSTGDADGDTLTTTGTAGHGSVVVHGDGTYTYTETDLAFTGTDTVTLQTSDGHGGTNSTTASIVVASGATLSASTTGGTGHGAITGSVVGSDAFSDTMGYTVSTQALHGTVAINATTGSYTYTPTGSWTGASTDSFVAKVTDGHGDTLLQTVSLSENNIAPIVSGPVSLGTFDDKVYTTINLATLTGNATDANGDALTVKTPLSATHGASFYNAGGGHYTVCANGYTGTITLSYTVTDSHGGNVAATATFSTTHLDPTVSGPVDLGSVQHSTTLLVYGGTLQSNATDVDGYVLSMAAAPTADHGATVTDNGDDTYTVNPNGYTGDITLSYSLSDGHGGSVATTAVVHSANTAPVVSGVVDLGSTSDNVAVVVSAATLLGTTTDANGDTLSLSGAPTVDHGSVVDNGDGTYTVSPGGYDGVIDLTYTVSDGHGGTAAGGATLTSTPAVPDVLTAADSHLTAVGSDVIDGQLVASSSRGEAISFGLGTGPAHGSVSIDATTGEYVYAPTNGFVGTDSFTWTATDADGSTTHTVTIDNEAAQHYSLSMSGAPASWAQVVTINATNIDIGRMEAPYGGTPNGLKAWFQFEYATHGTSGGVSNNADIGVSLFLAPQADLNFGYNFIYTGLVLGNGQITYWGQVLQDTTFTLHLRAFEPSAYSAGNILSNPFSSTADAGTITLTLHAGANINSTSGLFQSWGPNVGWQDSFTWGDAGWALPGGDWGDVGWTNWQGPWATGSLPSVSGAVGGNDQILGSATNDILVAHGSGNTLNGGGGSDTLVGGTGHDTFVLSGAGHASISGFTTGNSDVVQFDGYTAGQITAVDLSDGLHFLSASSGLDLGVLSGVHAADVSGSASAADAYAYLQAHGQATFKTDLASEIGGQNSYALAGGVHGGSLFAGDADNNPLTFTLANGQQTGATAHGSVTLLSDGSYTYASNDPYFYGTDSFQVRATDGLGHTVTQTITQTVLPHMAIPDVGAVSGYNSPAYDGSLYLPGKVVVSGVDAAILQTDTSISNWINVGPGLSGDSTSVRVMLDNYTGASGTFIHWSGTVDDPSLIQNGIAVKDVQVVLDASAYHDGYNPGWGFALMPGSITVTILAGTDINACNSNAHDGNGWYVIGLTEVASGNPEGLVSNAGSSLAYLVADGASQTGTAGADHFQAAGATATVTGGGGADSFIVSHGHELTIQDFSVAANDQLLIHGFVSNQITFSDLGDGLHVVGGGSDLAVLAGIHAADVGGSGTAADAHSYLDAHHLIHYS